jgi:hypothetical protein
MRIVCIGGSRSSDHISTVTKAVDNYDGFCICSYHVLLQPDHVLIP